MNFAESSKAGNGMKKVTLISSDNERFEVSEAAASLSQVIRSAIAHSSTDGGIPLYNVTGEVLARVLEYCNKHAAAGSKQMSGAATASFDEEAAAGSSGTSNNVEEEELKSFDEAFIDVDQSVLYDLLVAAEFLEVNGLRDLACQKAADMITTEEIRKTFGIQNDFIWEEEEEEEENQWVMF
ncbi:unnamed protein product [Urochloa decumbens]|uniref:SKP1-like protein n=1 Tax=Urochloa decumbens TaxID=240449 RepID=A0ABC9EBB5_9POAL